MTNEPALTPPPVLEVTPSIADSSYRSYEGELRNRTVRWWTISQSIFLSGFKKLGYWIPGGLTLVIYLIMGLGFYLSRNVRTQFGAAEPVNQYAISLNQGLVLTGLFLLVAALTIGAGSIAADNKANALLVYLSKPITRLDYLVGKWIGVFLLLATISFVPALLLYLFFLVAYTGDGFLKENPTLFLRMGAATLFPAALHTSLIIGFSSCSKSPRLAGSLYAALFFLSTIVSQVTGGVLAGRDKADKNTKTTALISKISINGIGNGLAEHLYDLTPREMAMNAGGGRRRNRRRLSDKELKRIPAERPPLVPLLLIGGALIVLPIAVATARVRAVEVVSG